MIYNLYIKNSFKFKLLILIIRIVYIGVKRGNESYINDKIKIFNLQNLISICQLLFSVLLYSFIGYYNSALVSFLLIPNVLVGFFLVKKHYYTTSKIYIFIYYNLCVLFGVIYYSHPIIDYYYLPILLALPMNFHKKEHVFLFFLILFTLILFILGISPLSDFLPKQYRDKTPNYSSFVVSFIMVTYIVNLVVTYVIYTNLNYKRTKKIKNNLINSKKKLMIQNIDIQNFSNASAQLLKSPVSELSLYVDKIEIELSKGKTFFEIEEYFDIVERNINNEEIFINKIFEYNKILTFSKTLKMTNISVFFKKVINDYKKIEVEAFLNDDFVILDRVLLEKIILIILDNSLKYNRNCSPKVIIKSYIENNNIIIDFEDNGIGIESHYSTKIFEPFFRVNEINFIEGVGLGLNIAKRAAEIINGELFLFSSSSTKGSVFRLILKK